MLVVVEKWSPRIFLVVDLFNESYDPDLAHLLEGISYA